jgi:exonuclease III
MRAPGGRLVPLSCRPGSARKDYEKNFATGSQLVQRGMLGNAQCYSSNSANGHLQKRQRHGLKIGTWNLLSLTGKELELVEEVKRYRLDIVGLSSTKRRGSDQLDLPEGWKLFLSGVDPAMSAQAGVGILTSPWLADRVVEWIPMGGRVAVLRVRLETKTLSLVQVYAPNLEAEYAAFLDEVDAALEKVPNTESFILMGDFNAHVGNDIQTWGSVIGRNGDAHQNANGEKVLDFCCANGLSIMNTFFQHKDIHKYTWYRDSLGQRSMIDFFIVSSDLKANVLDVCVKRGAELSTDHHLVVCTFRLQSPVKYHPKGRSQKAYRIRWEALEDLKTRERFAGDMACRFRQIPDDFFSVEEEWELFKTAIIASATECCGRKRLGVATDGEKRTAWWKTPGVQEAVREKKQTFKAWLMSKDSASRLRYTEARKAAAAAVKAAKEKSWEEFGERLESNFLLANKVFWQTICRLRGKKSLSVRGIKSKDGELLSNEEDILQRWREHFEDLLNPVSGTSDDRLPVQAGAETNLSVAEVISAIKSLKSGKAAGIDEIRPEMLKALGPEGVQWLTRVIQVAWNSGKAPGDWQTGVVIPIFKKGDRKECTNYRGISLLSLPGKVYAKVLEGRCREIVDSKIQEEQCGFRGGRSTTDQLFTLRLLFEKAWEFANQVYCCFVDLEKAYDRVPRGMLWRVLQEYGVDGQLLKAITSLYDDCRSCVRVGGIKSTSFTVGVGLRQGCVLSPLLFIIYMDWIARRSQGCEGVRIGDQKIRHLLFADDLVLFGSSEANLQHALEKFAAACVEAGMKISVAKSEALVLSRTPTQCTLHVSGVPLRQVEKFKYLGVFFSSDGKGDVELNTRIGQAGAVMRELGRSVVRKAELSQKAKISVFNSIYIPTLTYGHETWVMTERIRSRVQAAEMRFLRGVVGVSRLDRVRNTTIRENLQVEPLLLRIERSLLRWYGHAIRMPQERIAHQILSAQPSGRRPRGRPRMRWMDQIQSISCDRLGIPYQELESMAKDRETWKSMLNMLPPRPERTNAV